MSSAEAYRRIQNLAAGSRLVVSTDSSYDARNRIGVLCVTEDDLLAVMLSSKSCSAAENGWVIQGCTRTGEPLSILFDLAVTEILDVQE